MKRLLIVVLLAGGLASGCALLGGPSSGAGNPAPVITEAEQARVRQLATKALAGIEVAGIVVRDARQMVSDLSRQGVLSEAVWTQVNAAVIAANDVVQRVITEIAAATRVVTVEGLVRQVVAAILEVAAVLERQTDPRVQMAGTFVRGAISGVAALAGVR
jgi:hypothetical protein